MAQKPVLGVEIRSYGGAVPRTRVTNQELIDKGTPSDAEWIRDNTGIEARHICEDDENLVTLGVEAGREALILAGITPPATLDKLFLATTTSGTYRDIPGAHAAIQRRLREQGYHLRISDERNTACTGFMTALLDAYRYFEVDGIDAALVVGSDTLSRKTDYGERGTGILFGDGAGAVVLERTDANGGLLGWHEATDGREEDILYAEPNSTIVMDGPRVFKQAVKAMIRAGEIALERAEVNTGVKRKDIDLVIPHQANVRIIELAARKMGFDMDKVVIDLDIHGNTSSGSIPLALKRAHEQRRIKKGGKLLLVGFGAGMTEAAAVVEI